MFIEDALKQQCLILASGGLDSAYSLYTAAASGIKHRVLHVDIPREIEDVQEEALRRQINYLGKDKFHYHTMTIRGEEIPGDYLLAVILGTQLSGSFGGLPIVTGDDLRSRLNGYRLDALEALVRSYGLILAYRSKADDLVSKYLKLPLEYLALTWSCREPIERNHAWHKCGTCTPCKLHRQTGLWDALPKSMPMFPVNVATE